MATKKNVAKKVIKKAPTKKTVAKKASVKKAPAKKAPAKKAAVKKVVTKAPAKKAAKKASKTFLITYHMNAATQKKSAAMRKSNPEGMGEMMAAWMAWAKNCGAQLVDFGLPIGASVKLGTSGAAPSKRNMAGYSIVQASSMAEAKKLMKKHPHLWDGGCEIEIHEGLPMPGA